MNGTIEQPTPISAREVDRLAERVLAVFPTLAPDSRRVAVQLYRLLARGKPVSRNTLAEAASVSSARIDDILESWTGVYYDGDDVQGFWGITPRPVSRHLYIANGHTSYAWCAWDTLFLPEILGHEARVASTCPESDETVRLVVSPRGVLQVEPRNAVMSVLEPPADVQEDVVSKFCHYVHFFPSIEVGARWIARHPGTVLITIEDAFELGRRRNQGMFGDALAMPHPQQGSSPD